MLYADLKYSPPEQRRDWHRGDVLLLMSDGLPEMQRDDGTVVGYEDVRELFAHIRTFRFTGDAHEFLEEMADLVESIMTLSKMIAKAQVRLTDGMTVGAFVDVCLRLSARWR